MNKKKLPARFYNQINGKTPQENYKQIVEERQQKVELSPQAEKELELLIEQKLQDLFQAFKFQL